MKRVKNKSIIVLLNFDVHWRGRQGTLNVAVLPPLNKELLLEAASRWLPVGMLWNLAQGDF